MSRDFYKRNFRQQFANICKNGRFYLLTNQVQLKI